MDEDKVYTPQTIDDQPFPGGETQDLNTTQASANQTYAPKQIQDKPVPSKRIAVELLSASLNTRSKRILQEFQFGKSGAIQIGDYQEGVTGDVRISPNGIVGRDQAGVTTFAVDATTGDATFKGEVKAGSVVTGAVIVGNNALILDGAARSIIVNDGANDRVLIGNLDI